MKILAIDQATKSGWAVNYPALLSGTQDFSLKRGDSHGMRFLRMRAWLEEINRIKGEAGQAGMTAFFNLDEYKPVPWYIHLFGFLILILEGYILSCIIFFIYKEIKRLK